MEITDRERAGDFPSLELSVGLLGHAGVLGNVGLGEIQSLSHGTQPAAGRPRGRPFRGGQGGESRLQIGEEDLVERMFQDRL